MRRIVEGLGLGLARRAARKLVPVVLTLGSGPSGFPKNLSGRRPKLPRQPRRGRVARARSRNFDAGSWPVGLLETTFRATAEVPGDGQSFCDSLPRARFRRFGAGGWPDGLPETSFRAMQSGGILDADSHGKPAPSHARAPLFRRWGLARRASRNNFPGDGRSLRDSHGKPAPSHACAPLFWRWGLARRASRNTFPGDGQSFCDSLPRPTGFPKQVSERCKGGDLGRRQPWQTRAVARAHSVISALGAGPSGFLKQSSGRSFRDSHGKPAPSLAHAPLFWRWGLARRASRNVPYKEFISGQDKVLSTMAALSRSRTRQWPQWLPRIRNLSAAKPSHFYQGLAKRFAVLSRPASRSGRFIKGDGRFIKAGQPQ